MLLRDGLIGMTAMIAITVQPAVAETHQRQEQAPAPWTKLCGTDQATTKRACLTIMGARDDLMKVVITAVLIESGRERDGVLRVRWSRSVTVKQLGLQSWRVRASRRQNCLTDTCVAVFKLDKTFLTGLKKGRAIRVWAEAEGGRKLSFSLSPVSFTEMAQQIL